MPEFRIDGDTLRREVKTRVLSWSVSGGFALAAALLFILGIYRVLSTNRIYGLAFISLVLAFVISAGFLACREALYRAERQMVFILDNTAITRKRPGFPEIRIAFSEIGSLNEELGRLIVKSNESMKVIAVPRSVCGYGTIRAELAKHHALTAQARLPLKSTALLIAAILSWITVLLCRTEGIVIFAAIVGVATLALASRHLWLLWHRGRIRPFLLIALLLAWLVAFWLIYLRAIHL